MYRHSPSCLQGPVSLTRGWWTEIVPEGPVAGNGPSGGGHSGQPDDRIAEQAGQDAEIRAELVARVRREIAEGTYDTPAKFEKALEKLLERLQEE